MALTDAAVRSAKPKEKPFKLADSGGMFLLVQPSGGKLWRWKYRVDGKEKKLSLGTYPDVSLAQARAGRDAARTLLKRGVDPSVQKSRDKAAKQIAAGNTFEAIGREFIAQRSDPRNAKAWSPATLVKQEWFFDHLRPALGKIPISDIQPIDVLHVLRKVEAAGKLETARRVQQLASLIFRFAVATARLSTDPTRDLRGALMAPAIKHLGAITDPIKAGELLRAIDGYEGHRSTVYALRIAPHVFVRPGELRYAEWREVDLDGALWIIPAGRMKMRKPHHVPLSKQSVALFKELRDLSPERQGYIFPSIRSTARAMSENTLNAALRRLGYTSDEMTAHGFRAMASTLLNESGKWHPDAIERALAHQDSDSVRAAYHRGAHWDERVRMAQWWSDELDRLRRGADVIPIKAKGRR